MSSCIKPTFTIGRGWHPCGVRRCTVRLATYVVNLHINISNLCINRCRFCAFRREAEDAGAYELTPEQVWAMAEEKAPPGVTEFHLVSGLNPALNLRFCKRTLEGLRERFPQVHLKAFTAVEIAHLAKDRESTHSGNTQRVAVIGPWLPDRRRRGNTQSSRSRAHLPRQTRWRRLFIGASRGTSPWHSLHGNAFVWPHGNPPGAPRASPSVARPAG